MIKKSYISILFYFLRNLNILSKNLISISLLFKTQISYCLIMRKTKFKYWSGAYPFVLAFCYCAPVQYLNQPKGDKVMTDKIKYSNISVSKDTYAKLQQISKQILPA